MKNTARPIQPQPSGDHGEGIGKIVPPIGGKKRGRPKNSWRRDACLKMGVSMRNLERAIVVRRHGIPALHGFVEQGELDLGPAEIIARMSQDLQREACGMGARLVRAIANDIRRELMSVRKPTTSGLA